MFMHGGVWHILFNMYALWAFGTPLEMRWGRTKFLFFYFSAGLGAALVHTLANYYNFQEGVDALVAAGANQADITEFLSNPANGIYKMYQAYHVPAVGASGAIYGILVAFAMMFPNIELMLIFLPVPIKAKYFVPLIILGDLIFGITGSPLGIAHWAHIGGALLGFIMAWYWKKNSFDNTRLY